MVEMSDSTLSSRLNIVLNRIERDIIDDNSNDNSSSDSLRFKSPVMSEMVDLNNSSTLYSLAERVVGVESL